MGDRASANGGVLLGPGARTSPVVASATCSDSAPRPPSGVQLTNDAETNVRELRAKIREQARLSKLRREWEQEPPANAILSAYMARLPGSVAQPQYKEAPPAPPRVNPSHATPAPVEVVDWRQALEKVRTAKRQPSGYQQVAWRRAVQHDLTQRPRAALQAATARPALQQHARSRQMQPEAALERPHSARPACGSMQPLWSPTAPQRPQSARQRQAPLLHVATMPRPQSAAASQHQSSGSPRGCMAHQPRSAPQCAAGNRSHRPPPSAPTRKWTDNSPHASSPPSGEQTSPPASPSRVAACSDSSRPASPSCANAPATADQPTGEEPSPTPIASEPSAAAAQAAALARALARGPSAQASDSVSGAGASAGLKRGFWANARKAWGTGDGGQEKSAGDTSPAYSKLKVMARSGILARPTLRSKAQRWWTMPPETIEASKTFDNGAYKTTHRGQRMLGVVNGNKAPSQTDQEAYRKALRDVRSLRFFVPEAAGEVPVRVVIKKEVIVDGSKWSVHQSIWKERKHWADSGAFHDTEELVGRCIETDWQRCLENHNTQGYITKLDGSPSCLEACKDVLLEYASFICSVRKGRTAREDSHGHSNLVMQARDHACLRAQMVHMTTTRPWAQQITFATCT